MIALLIYIVGGVRGVVYKMGFRPKFGSSLYSPSLALRYGCQDADIAGAFAKGLEQGKLQEPAPKPHKHKFQFSSVSSSGKIGRRLYAHDENINFHCLENDCPWSYSLPYGGINMPYTVTIPRWKWNEMTLSRKEVDQVWPG